MLRHIRPLSYRRAGPVDFGQQATSSTSNPAELAQSATSFNGVSANGAVSNPSFISFSQAKSVPKVMERAKHRFTRADTYRLKMRDWQGAVGADHRKPSPQL